ncbi:DUF2271 domain-containing protein [Anaeroselena agilis]|uniref:DUF2271 domain-containing protein n=1 Tax=Anaeroselena agilis TaxID=3063788 RepID=A0ABU3NX72_9FIRM|nr:DUF2271 domain-containing protein [Selenomonadales bacterium 4137-cl]
MRPERRIILLALIILAATAAAAFAAGVADQAPGAVTISYELQRMPTIASNQMAVWVEDSDGKYIKTLLVTRFTGRGGYERRPECLPLWRKAAGVGGPPTATVDAVTSATQQPGPHTLVWDCTDSAGRPVAPGSYAYKVEGTLFWAKEILWEGEIAIGDRPSSSQAVVSYLPPGVGEGAPMIDKVSASFAPATATGR